MNNALLYTKLFAPPPGERLVERLRLFDLLDEGTRQGRRLSLVCASAGYGKTTLVSSWLRERKIAYGWIGLDEEDNDPKRFLMYWSAAFQNLVPRVEQELSQLLALAQSPGIETFMRFTINELASHPTPVVLVLDDYYRIQNETIHNGLRFLIDHAPPSFHLIILTREDPPFGVSKLRVRGQVVEIRAGQLRFTPAEISQMLQRVNIPEKTGWLEALEQRTEGWAAGLCLALILLQGCEDPQKFIDSFRGSHRYILDYLFEEVLEQQDEATREFLYRTAFLRRLCAPLCDAIVSRVNGMEPGDSRKMIARIEQANLFLIPLDDQRIWYRYHHLFAESLQASYEQIAADDIAKIHRRAALWFENNGNIEEAVYHALEAAHRPAGAPADFSLAARLISGAYQTILFERSLPQTMLNWLDKIPTEIVAAQPVLQLGYAFCSLYVGQLEQAMSLSNAILEEKPAARTVALDSEAQPAVSAASRTILGGAHLVKAIAANLMGNAWQTGIESRQALNLLPETELFQRAFAFWVCGQANRLTGNSRAAEDDFATTVRLAQACGSRFLYYLGRTNQLDRIFEQGRLTEAETGYRQEFEDENKGAGWFHPIATLARIRYGEIQYERNRLTEALEQVEKGLEIAKQLGIQDILLNSYLALMRVQWAMQNTKEAVRALQAAIQTAQAYGVPAWLARVKAMQTELSFMQGNKQAAWDWVNQVEERLAGGSVDHSHLGEYQTLAHMYERQGKYQQALQILEQMRASALAGGRFFNVVRIDAQKAGDMEAMAAQDGSDARQADAALLDVLRMAQPEGYARTFLEKMELIGPALERLRRTDIEPELIEYINMLLSMQGNLAPPAKSQAMASPPVPAQPGMVEPLNSREIEILKLIAEGLSNKEICLRLSLSLGTVKWYTNSLYGKLGASNRAQAIIRGQEIGVL